MAELLPNVPVSFQVLELQYRDFRLKVQRREHDIRTTFRKTRIADVLVGCVMLYTKCSDEVSVGLGRLTPHAPDALDMRVDRRCAGCEGSFLQHFVCASAARK
jgi:mRNA-degrading endonuclease YafQ of YafQ-DinJ toxin-antitoxin module